MSSKRISSINKLLLWVAFLAHRGDAFVSSSHRQSYDVTMTRLWSTETNDEVEVWMQKAAKLRAEIAKMEGKSVQEVEDEAKAKKEDDARRERQREADRLEAKKNSKNASDDGRFLQLPTNHEEMVRQAARAVERAFRDGVTRQTIRFDLISENQAVADENEWPGGAKQMYREAGKPLADALLKQLYAPTKPEDSDAQRLPPQVKSQDLWDFDGSALHTAEAAQGPSGDVQALVFPNTDTKYIGDIEKISEAMGPRLFLLVNPFWRNVESWGFNLLAPGAKERAQKVIFDNGYNETYSVMSFQVRGEKCAALKVYPYDWQIFAFIEDYDYGGMESIVRLGSCDTEPTTALVTKLLNERPEFKDSKTMRQMKNTLGNGQ